MPPSHKILPVFVGSIAAPSLLLIFDVLHDLGGVGNRIKEL
jgi:hypothetical protein